MLLILIGLVLTGATVALVLRAVAMPRLEAVARLGQIQAYGFSAEADAVVAEAAQRTSTIDRLASRVGRMIAAQWKAFDEAEVRKTLMTAGLYTTTPMTFLGYRALSGVTLPLAMLWYLTASGVGGMMFVAGLGFGVF